jgi:vacuolar protein sorting-associated protein 35
MDRLSAYAQRESESESPDQRKKTEEEAIANLMEQLRLQKDQKLAEPQPSSAQQNGDASEATTLAESESESTSSAATAVEPSVPETPTENDEPEANGEVEKLRGIPTNVKLFEIFHEQVATLVKMQRLSIQDTVGLLVSLANLALNIYPERLDYVDQVLAFANQKVTEFANSADLHSQACQSQILSLLLAPIKTYVSMFTALALPSFIPLLHNQPYPTRRAVAGEVARSLLRNQTRISSVENLESVLEILKVLIKEGMQQATGYPGGPIQRRAQETDETIEEQGWLARIVHYIHGSDNDTQFKLLQAARKAFAEGNERVKFTTPAIITASIKLARQYKKREHFDDNWQSQSSALYKFMHSTLSTLYTRVTGSADLSLRLFIACGQVADQNGFEEVAYEFFAQAFTIYEEAISDSRAQFQAVCVIASALHTTRNFGKENYDTLITKCALHGSKLLKKPDQCRAVYLASHLWWATEIRALGEEDAKNVRVHSISPMNSCLLTYSSSIAMVNGSSSACSAHSG